MEMSVLHKKLMVTAVGVLPLPMSGQLSAQNSGVLEEVIVTAQKREQNILEIPFAVSVVGEDEIKARGALDIKDLQYSIPGLSISSNFPGQDRVQIRGASSDVGIGSPTVGRYLDEVSVNSDATQRALTFHYWISSAWRFCVALKELSTARVYWRNNAIHHQFSRPIRN